jgi:TonB-dependent SusC/RagA subfamily outer membrane receptor
MEWALIHQPPWQKSPAGGHARRLSEPQLPLHGKGASMTFNLRSSALPLALLLCGMAACGGGKVPRDSTPRGTVTSEDLQRPGEPIESVLQRQVPGLRVVRTSDGGIALQVRGTSSFTGANTPPHFVLNGLPYQPGPEGALVGIDPYEIESIKVLKGAEAALYGIDGANGVIVITTRKAGPQLPPPPA